jgi:WD40 repeat protein/tetratricopeptide (TPR) repeat protein
MTVSTQNQRALHTLARAISLSQGEFSLILVRCNYTSLQERMVKDLHQLLANSEIDSASWLEIKLDCQVKTLYSTIIHRLNELENQPSGLMIFGLDSVVAIDQLFQSSNQVRDEFRKNCPFPLVLWMTEKLLQKLTRWAPDFKSWAAASIKFEASIGELIQLWQNQDAALLARVLDGQAGLAEWAIASPKVIHDLPVLPLASTVQGTREQLESALQDLQRQKMIADPLLVAMQHFVIGRYDHALSRIDSALAHYEQSFSFWQSRSQGTTGGKANIPRRLPQPWQGETPRPANQQGNPTPEERQGVLLLYMGLCYWRLAELDQASGYMTHWQAARPMLERCLQVFEDAGRRDLVAKFVPLLGEVLRRLQAWDELAALAQTCLTRHHQSGNPVQLAQNYGFLAEVATQKQQWEQAKSFAQQALTTVASSPVPMRQHQSLYLLLLARALSHLGQSVEAISYLKLAFSGIAPEDDPRLYIQILKELRSLYYNQREYQQAFMLKKYQRDIEHQYRFRPFIGASQLPAESVVISSDSALGFLGKSPRISSLGREQDINNLLSRLARPDQKLIVIYGESGVGKSSLINAGLVPALHQQPMGDRLTLPIVLRTYKDWAIALANRLHLNLPVIPAQHSEISLAADWILDKLRQNADRNLVTVLIFAQFEEFFFILKKTSERQYFYDFMQACLDIPFTKVILSLRQDCLYNLLDIDFLAKLEVINKDILNKNIIYYLDDFTLDDAKNVINTLTKESQFYLEPALINALVNDLANERGRVRPIELQLLCNQLQEDEQDYQKINTLSQYRQLGPNPKQTLMEHFLHQSIKDCGAENQAVAWKVLYQLTHDRGTRPLRMKSELAGFLGSQASQLDVVLEILVQSGLVVLHREASGDHYQLIHDYLVQYVREAYEKKFGLKVELQKTQTKLEKSHKQLKIIFKLTVLISVFLAVLSGLYARLWLQADSRKQNLQISAITASSEALFVSQRDFDALIEGLRAWKKLQGISSPTSDTTLRVVTALQQAIYNVKEKNRINGHGAEVWSVNFSPDGQFLASAGNDTNLKIWRRNGSLYRTIQHSAQGTENNVTFVSFSPSGKEIASASRDRTVKLWNIETGELILTLKGHTDIVYSLSFNSTGDRIATTSNDGTIKLWQVSDGRLLQTFSGHQSAVNWVSFSPRNNLLASVSDDKTLKIWTYDGQLVASLNHQAILTVVGFTADGQTIISGDITGKIQRWDWDNNYQEWNSRPTQEWQAHQGGIYSLSFSRVFHQSPSSGTSTQKEQTAMGNSSRVLPNMTEDSASFSPVNTAMVQGQMLATAGQDSLVKVWHLDGELFKEFAGHSGRVTTVSFSPDAQLIATASFDKTVRLWSLADGFRHPSWVAHGHRITTVRFSPNGQLIASGSRDNTVKIWRQNGRLLRTLIGHGGYITSLSFSPDGNFLVSGSWDNTINLWRVNDGRLLKTFVGHSDRVTSVTFSANGRMIVSGSRDRTIKVWRTDGTLVRTLTGHSDRVNSVDVSPDGQLIVSGSDDQTVKLWSQDGTLLNTLAGDNGHRSYVTSVRFSPNGQLIASAGWDNTVKLWHRDGKFQKTLLQGYSDSVESLSFSPDGKTLASASWDNTIKLWNIQDGTLIKILLGHTSGVIDVSFSPDGQSIVSGSDDLTIIVWNLNLDNLIQMTCDWVSDYLKYNHNVSPNDAKICDSVNKHP